MTVRGESSQLSLASSKVNTEEEGGHIERSGGLVQLFPKVVKLEDGAKLSRDSNGQTDGQLARQPTGNFPKTFNHLQAM